MVVSVPASMSLLPADWALATTHLASDYVCCQFCAIVGVTLKVLPLPELDVVLMLGCSHLARILADAYLNPGNDLSMHPVSS
jgi:hypothetical protein